MLVTFSRYYFTNFPNFESSINLNKGESVMKTLISNMDNKKLAASSILLGALLAKEAFASPVTVDFNGDGYQDLVVGVSD